MAVAKLEVTRRPKPAGYVSDPDDAKTWASKADGLTLDDTTLSLKSGDAVLSSVELPYDIELLNSINTEVREAAGKAAAAEKTASAASEQAQESAAEAAAASAAAIKAADHAEQSAATLGYMQCSIDENGHLIFTKTDNVDTDFRLEEGRLVQIWQ